MSSTTLKSGLYRKFIAALVEQAPLPEALNEGVVKAWLKDLESLSRVLSSLVIYTGNRNSKCTLLYVRELTVLADYNHDTQIAKFAKEFIDQYGEDHYNKDITDANCSKVSHQLIPNKTYLVPFWQINKGKTMASQEILQFLEANGVLFTGMQGLSIVQQQIPDALPIGKWTNSFDKKENLLYASGDHRVPYIVRHSGGDRYCPLGGFDDGCGDGDCLFGLCDPETLNPQLLSFFQSFIS